MQQNQEEGGGWEWGGTIYTGNRGKNEKTRGKDAISRAAESWGLLVHTHLKKIPKQEGSLAGQKAKVLGRLQTITAQTNREDQAHNLPPSYG